MKLGKLHRTLGVRSAEVNAEARTIEFAFSSETPVDRWFGAEVLSHRAGAADLARLNDGAALLWNHDMDRVLGVIESAEIRDGRGYAKARFSDNPDAIQKFKEIESGILRNVSFGYRVLEMERTKSGAEGDEFTATKWEPYEVSIVSVPADATVGIGRADGEEELEVRVIEKNQGEKVSMEPTKTEPTVVDTSKIKNEGALAERARIATIQALGEKHGKKELARQLIEGDKSLDEARAAFLDAIQASAPRPAVEGAAMLDLSDKQKREYSVLRAIRAASTGNWKDAGFERELSEEIAKRMGRETTGFFMPLNTRTAYNTGTATAGGNLVATDLMSGEFIDLLRAKMLVAALGAKTLSGLSGNVAIPKQTGSGTAYWVSEGSDVTESEGTFGQVTMSPKTVGARSQMTRQMIMQGTPDIEMLVRNDLAQVIALAIDAAAIKGTGSSGQPTGILNQAGIGSVAMGTNGAAATNIDPFIDLETLVASANADFGSLAYLTNPTQIGKIKKLKDSNNNYLWNGIHSAVGAGVPGEVNGYKVGRSTQVPSNLTKGTSSGVCSALLFGNFADLVIGQWGPGVEILANPFGAGYNSGSIDVRALASVDIAVRNAASFAAVLDLL